MLLFLQFLSCKTEKGFTSCLPYCYVTFPLYKQSLVLLISVLHKQAQSLMSVWTKCLPHYLVNCWLLNCKKCVNNNWLGLNLKIPEHLYEEFNISQIKQAWSDGPVFECVGGKEMKHVEYERERIQEDKRRKIQAPMSWRHLWTESQAVLQ